jgi:hypothetical protein
MHIHICLLIYCLENIVCHKYSHCATVYLLHGHCTSAYWCRFYGYGCLWNQSIGVYFCKKHRKDPQSVKKTVTPLHTHIYIYTYIYTYILYNCM